MAYLIWLVLMGILLAFIAVPIAQRVGYAYGRFGRMGNMILVIVGTLVAGVLFSLLTSAIGMEVSGESGALIGGIIGGVLVILLLSAFAVKSANEEPNSQEDIAG